MSGERAGAKIGTTTSKIRGGEASSPRFEAPVGLLGDGKVARMKIDAGRRRRSDLDGGSAARERGEGGRKVRVGGELGAAFIGWRRKGRGGRGGGARSVVGDH
jgi:hypothetical protein